MALRTFPSSLTGLSLLWFYFGLLEVLQHAEGILRLPRSLQPESCPPTYEDPPLILVSMDGFRADYLERGHTPTIAMLSERGVTAPFIKPSYPSITFPNHYTLVTGLLPAYHGIVANKFYDPEFNATFRVGRPEFFEKRWWGGEPIWQTVERQGKISAVYFWPGSETEGRRPTHWSLYNITHEFDVRVEQVLSWLDLPLDRRPSFLGLYMHEPDRTGHKYGPSDSPEMTLALKKVDDALQHLLVGLQKRNLLSCVNLIVLADHGMAEAGRERLIDVRDLVPDIKSNTRYWNGVFPRFEPLDKSYGSTQRMLKSLSCQKKEMRVYHKDDLPIRWHLGGQKRIEDVIIDLDSGYQVDFDGTYRPDKGDHGYDNIFYTMNALFLAFGPSFVREAEVESFQNIEIYNLMCALLGVQPAPNNGTWGALHHLLKDPPTEIDDNDTDDNEDIDYSTFGFLPKNLYSWETRVREAKCSYGKNCFYKILSTLRWAEKNRGDLLQFHLPWGVPHMKDDFLSVQLLLHEDHVTGFSEQLKLPLWTAFHYGHYDADYEDSAPTRWIDDVRIPAEKLHKPCLSDNLSWNPLFHPGFSTNRIMNQIPYLSSNAVPISTFLIEKWTNLLRLIKEWSDEYDGINVILGTIFDFNHDTIAEDFSTLSYKDSRPLVPTHLYAVVTRCLGGNNLDCPPDWLDVQAFVFPQNLSVSNCLTFEEFAREFSAKVSDVETITGLKFYPHLKFEDRVRLKIRIHSNLWGKESWENRLRSDIYGLKK